jgi:hypothetical protein
VQQTSPWPQGTPSQLTPPVEPVEPPVPPPDDPTALPELPPAERPPAVEGPPPELPEAIPLELAPPVEVAELAAPLLPFWPPRPTPVEEPERPAVSELPTVTSG